jgi:hypothetical protein
LVIAGGVCLVAREILRGLLVPDSVAAIHALGRSPVSVQ